MLLRSERVKKSIVSFMVLAMFMFVLQPFTAIMTQPAHAYESHEELLAQEAASAGLEVSGATIDEAAEILAAGDFENAMRLIEEETLARTVTSVYDDHGLDVPSHTLEDVVVTIQADEDIESSLGYIRDDLYEESDDFEAGELDVDINHASVEELTRLDGVGEAYAENIVEYREEMDGFESVEELTEVSGIGPATLENNLDNIMVSSIDEGEGLVDLNNANQAQLEQLSGIGEATAESIIEYREANGGFASVDELTEVSGIGDATLENNEEQLEIGEMPVDDEDAEAATAEREEEVEERLDEAAEDEETSEQRADALDAASEELQQEVQDRMNEIAQLNQDVAQEAEVYASELSDEITSEVSEDLEDLFRDNALDLANTVQQIAEGDQDVDEAILEYSDEFAEALSSGIRALALQKGISESDANNIAETVGGNAVELAETLLEGDDPVEAYIDNANSLGWLMRETVAESAESLGVDEDLASSLGYGGRALARAGAEIADGESPADAIHHVSTDIGIAAGRLGRQVVDNLEGTNQQGMAADAGIRATIEIGSAVAQGHSVSEALEANRTGVVRTVDRSARALAEHAGLDGYSQTTVGQTVQTADDIIAAYQETGDFGQALQDESDNIADAAERITQTVIRNADLGDDEAALLQQAVEATGGVAGELLESGDMEEAMLQNQELIEDVLVETAGELGERYDIGDEMLSNVQTALSGGEITGLFEHSGELDWETDWDFASSGGELTDGADGPVDDYTLMTLAEDSFEKELLSWEGEIEGEAAGFDYSGSAEASAGVEGSYEAELGRTGYTDGGEHHEVYGARASGEISATVEASAEGEIRREEQIAGHDVEAWAEGEVSAEAGASAEGEVMAGVIDGQAIGARAEGEAFVGARAEGEVSTGVSAGGVTGEVGATGRAGVGLGASGTFDVQIGWDGISWDVGGGAYVGVGAEFETAGSLDFSGAFDTVAETAGSAWDSVTDTAESAWDSVTSIF